MLGGWVALLIGGLLVACASAPQSGWSPCTFVPIEEEARDVVAQCARRVNAAGAAVPALAFENGPDYFVAGFARTIQGGKIGFIDEDLRVRIPPLWDFAFPFESDRAVVCDGCTFRSTGDGHSEVVGGRWGVIDCRGEIVIPVIHSREEVMSSNYIRP